MKTTKLIRLFLLLRLTDGEIEKLLRYIKGA